jgi:hypothetical protein
MLVGSGRARDGAVSKLIPFTDGHRALTDNARAQAAAAVEDSVCVDRLGTGSSTSGKSERSR